MWAALLRWAWGAMISALTHWHDHPHQTSTRSAIRNLRYHRRTALEIHLSPHATPEHVRQRLTTLEPPLQYLVLIASGWTDCGGFAQLERLARACDMPFERMRQLQDTLRRALRGDKPGERRVFERLLNSSWLNLASLRRSYTARVQPWTYELPEGRFEAAW
jgi:hypothetical protein